MNVTLEYDGAEKMVVTLTGADGEVMSATNRVAKNQMKSKNFTDGGYLGIWGANTTYSYSQQIIKNLRLDYVGEVRGESKTLCGTVVLEGGIVDVFVDSLSDGILDADLVVKGEAGLSVEEGTLAVAGWREWLFDLSSGAQLTLKGDMAFGASAIVIDAEGDVGAEKKCLVDMTGLTGASRPVFSKGDGLPATVQLLERDGKLWASKSIGTVIVIK